jgi:hypothetical protein
MASSSPTAGTTDPSDEVNPDDLTTTGEYRGPEPPEETGQTVSAPSRPESGGADASVRPATFQWMKHEEHERYRVRTWSPRAVDTPPDDGYGHLGRYGSASDLRDAIASDLSGETYTIEFEESDGSTYVEHDAGPGHEWLGDPRFDLATIYADGGERDESVRV